MPTPGPVTPPRDDGADNSQEFSANAPAVSLPKGGGAIRGIGEKFAANPVNGTGSMSVPIATSPGRAGFGPKLSLSYNSGAGNGPFGFGWQLSLPTITRKTDKGLPRYFDAEGSDVFLLSGSEDLVPVLKENAAEWEHEEFLRAENGTDYRILRYRPRIEGLFARIERWTRLSDGDIHWRSVTKDNIATLYGKDLESRIADPSDPARIFSWLICESYDDKGNAIRYEYAREDSAKIDLTQVHERNRTDLSRSANRYLKRIKYGNGSPRTANEDLAIRSDWMFETVFDYDEGHLESVAKLDDYGEQEIIQANAVAKSEWSARADAFSNYRAGFEVRTYRLGRRVLMFHHFPDELGTDDYLVRLTEFEYAQEPIASFLNSVRQAGCVLSTNNAYPAGSYLKKSLPPVEFTYSQAAIQSDVQEVDPGSLENLPQGLDGSNYEWVDLDGEGVSGVLYRGSGGWLYKRNYSPIADQLLEETDTQIALLGASEAIAEIPSLAAESRLQFMDLAGDGRPDLVQMAGPVPGFYERTVDAEWESFTAFESVPNIDWSDPDLKLIDLTGDGYADILITEDEAITWYASLGEGGFESSECVAQSFDEEEGPHLVFSEGTDSIYLADLSGDGLTDLVRVRNGEICYWPNLGYGRFGPKVTMGNAPVFDAPDLFDQKRIRLADIDGSGTTDVLYLNSDRIDVYRNQSGNSWADVEEITGFSSIDDLTAVQAVDLLGNGTACLVWSSPLAADAGRQMRYIDLMGGQKPHLLVAIANNLGAETRVEYTPSTRFYLQDKFAGKPWITRLPFPVHVVERVEIYDWISRNRFVTRYAYHHGYFDGPEREFRGFGMVEQLDTEEFATLGASDEFPTGANIDESSHVPPLLTKTWFHTGAYLEGESISQQYVGEYYSEPSLSESQAQAQLLPDTVLPDNLDATETREAVRALKGAILRQEIYALDGTEKSAHPYSVSERNYSLRRLQPLADNPYAVFFTFPREQIDYQYERNPTDPRVAHALTLEVDDFGNVLKSAAVGYGRRVADASLSAEDQTRQTAMLVATTENDYTNAVDEDDAYRTPLLAETRAFEATGLTLKGGERFEFDELAEALAGAAEIAYETSPAGSAQKRLLAKARTLYRMNDLSGPLPLGKLDSRAIPYQGYSLAFTPGLLLQVYAGKGVDSILSDEAAYVDLDGDSNWWAPSGRSYFSPNIDASAAEELAEAESHFFLPRRFEDAFGAQAFVEYDRDLLPAKTTDPVGNTTSAVNDYRVLQASLVTDPNGNRAAVAFDALGLVVGTAVMGKETELLGDSLNGFESDLDPGKVVAYFQSPLSDAATLLQNATTRLIYDLFAYYRDKTLAEPSVVGTIARETHVSDLASGEQSKVQVSLAYSDGFGREAQKKIQAEPGPLAAGGMDVKTRWVGSGWTIFNNKGKPVRQYEPFFSDTDDFEFARTAGVSPILLYDPPQRVLATIHANHSWEKVVFDPWEQTAWDANDTVLIDDPGQDDDVGGYVQRLEPGDYQITWYGQRLKGALGENEQSAAEKAAAHANTPSRAYFDSLGRPFLSVADNGPGEQYETRTESDIRGLPLSITDARGNRVMAYTYDLLKRPIYSNSMDAGERWILPNVVKNPIRRWDSREQTFRTLYDQLQRPTRLFVKPESSAELLVEGTVFGELHPDANTHNLRGKAYQQFDGAGAVTNDAFDFKSNLLKTNRRLAVEYKNTVDWSVIKDLTDTKEIESAAAVLLEDETFTQSNGYDALNRVCSQVLPDKTEIQHTYNEANFLEQVKARLHSVDDWTTFVEDLDYNAKGQRERIEYGNGVVTDYAYDELTFQLICLKTTGSSDGDLQELSYTYDPVGNITCIRDEAQQTIFFAGEEVTPDAEYTYDGIYRLIEATGREQIGQTTQVDENDPLMQTIPHPNDSQAMRRYTEKYDYDAVGNILKMRHTADMGNWTRYYEYEEVNNRLKSTSLPGDDPLGPYSAKYTHDEHGNMATMPHLSEMEWDFKDQLHRTAKTETNNGGSPERTYYVYDAGGQRVRKVTENQAAAGETPTRKNERVYAGGYEVYREFDSLGTATLERETVHIMDDKRRIALVETKTTSGNISSPTALTRYQLDNHLGSACLEVNEDKQVISYEEYHPYGTTAYHSSDGSDKRYRYSGKERDDETDFYYFGARFYVPWLGRWTRPDPMGSVDGANLYRFTRNRPTCLVDLAGDLSYPGWWDPVALANRLDAAVDVAQQFYEVDNTGVMSSLWNTAVVTTGTVVKGSTNILKVGTGAAVGVEDIKRGLSEEGDVYDIVIGVSRIASDAGEVAGASVGLAGTGSKVASSLKVASVNRSLEAARAERAALDAIDQSALTRAERTQKVRIAETVGELESDVSAAKAGLEEVKGIRATSSKGTEVRQGIDKAYVGSRDWHPASSGPTRRVTVVEAKGTSAPKSDPLKHLGQTKTLGTQMSDRWVGGNLQKASQSGSRGAQKLAQDLQGTLPERYLTVADVRGGSSLYSLGGQGSSLSATGISGITPELQMTLAPELTFALGAITNGSLGTHTF